MVVQTGGGGGGGEVVKLVLLAIQPVGAPTIFFGTIYQLYKVAPVRPVALYALTVTLAVGVDGAVGPVHK